MGQNGQDLADLAGGASLTALFTGLKVLVLEDDPVLAARMREVLDRAGFAETAVVGLGEEAVAAAGRERFDVMVLDRLNPGLEGLEALRRIRAAGGGSSMAPALVVTALGDPARRVEGLLGGADDYAPKPLGEDEMLARLAAMVRRARWAQTASDDGGGPPALPAGQVNGPLVLDPAARTAHFAGQPLDLTGKGFSILSTLSAHVGHPVTRLMLWEACWPEWAVLPDQWTNTIDVAIRRLRRALEPVEMALPEAYRPLIVNVRSAGFLIRDLSGLPPIPPAGG